MKPVVYFYAHPDNFIVKGMGAVLTNVIDHPTLGTVDYRDSIERAVFTSVVTDVSEFGFETVNTIYAVKFED